MLFEKVIKTTSLSKYGLWTCFLCSRNWTWTTFLMFTLIKEYFLLYPHPTLPPPPDSFALSNSCPPFRSYLEYYPLQVTRLTLDTAGSLVTCSLRAMWPPFRASITVRMSYVFMQFHLCVSLIEYEFYEGSNLLSGRPLGLELYFLHNRHLNTYWRKE